MKTLKIILAVLLFTAISFAQEEYTSPYTGEQIDNGIRPYKVYTALLTANAGVVTATIHENTVGDIVWTLDEFNGNDCTGTLTGAFLENKVWAIANSDYQELIVSEASYQYLLGRTTDNTVKLYNYQSGMGAYTGVWVVNIEIRVYP